ncbi:MAG TPA: hypothetical protein VM406_14075 [Noviherbaspirillum sp.]|nr:hypothetical protein [Noviherbaspirillum sp.]
MSPFNRLPGSRRAAAGLEWKVLKKLPATLLSAALGCACFILLLRAGWFDLGDKEALTAQYSTLGFLLSFAIITLHVAFVCGIIIVMKGHAYVWDAYYLPDQDSPAAPLRARVVQKGRERGQR